MFINVLTQIFILMVLMLVGVILAKIKILDENSTKSLTDIVLYLVTPCVIINSFIQKFELSKLKNLLICFLIAFLLHILFIVLCKFFIKDSDKNKERVLQFGVIFANCGYMSIPLQNALLGEIGVFYGSSFSAVFNLFVWSYGIYLMSGNKKYIYPKNLIFNPGIIGITVGLIIFLFSLPIPKILSEPISYLASLNTPLPMIILGFHLANKKLTKEIKNIKYIFYISVKLVFIPLLSLFLLYLCGIRGDMLVSTVISCSAPTAIISTMFASKFDTDVSLSINMVSLCTILSLFTMPPIITLAQYLA